MVLKSAIIFEIVLQRAAPPQEHWDAYSIAGTPAARPARPAAKSMEKTA